MKYNKLLIGFALSAGMVANANADNIMNNWSINAVGIDSSPNNISSTASNIDHMAFDSTFHVVLSAPAAVGTTFVVSDYGDITTFFNAANQNVSPILYNTASQTAPFSGGELTFFFQLSGLFTSQNADGTFNFGHTGGTLDFYWNNIGANPGQQIASNAFPSHATDGVLVASFNVVNDTFTNLGGTYNGVQGQGGDQAKFTLATNPLGFFRDSLGNALLAGTSVALTNSDFHSNVSNSGAFNFVPASFSSANVTGGCPGGDQQNFCGTENGQVRLGIASSAPEPDVLALLGIGVFAFGAARRRQVS